MRLRHQWNVPVPACTCVIKHDNGDFCMLYWCSGAPSKRQTELANWTAKEATDHLCSGQITSSEYTQALLEQIELHACLNNFAAFEPDKVWPGPCSLLLDLPYTAVKLSSHRS